MPKPGGGGRLLDVIDLILDLFEVPLGSKPVVPHVAVESFNPNELGDEVYRAREGVNDVLKVVPESIRESTVEGDFNLVILKQISAEPFPDIIF